jgi:hypothetical protein
MWCIKKPVFICTSGRGVRYSLAALLTMITLVGLCTGVFRVLFVPVSGHDVDANAANKHLRHSSSPLRLPSTAKHITFRATFVAAQAVFNVDEGHFLDWMTSHGWKPRPISGTRLKEADSLALCFHDDSLTAVSDGYWFSNSSHRGGWDVIYDRVESKVWVHYSHH